MHNQLKKIFLNDNLVMAVILFNAAIIYLQVSGFEHNLTVGLLDTACTIFFLLEMIVKHKEYGVEGYWSNGWNRLDGTLVILSIPSLLDIFIPTLGSHLSILLVLRTLRVLRFIRVMHFFPNFTKVIHGFRRAMRQSYGVMLSFFVIIVVFGLLNCSLFRDADPEHFGTPLRSIYSVFQICTIEGWYEIPDNISAYYDSFELVPHFVRVYFIILLIMGGIIGMSFINSIFVDAMASDNNQNVDDQLEAIKKQLDDIQKSLKK